mmetsp:Transcript_37730/g.73884  ORF Transcript_37730/g.73884 Transcript_37730/m.73884 type:complete len:101 (-) Transcript_37730:1123-1425(-)
MKLFTTYLTLTVAEKKQTNFCFPVKSLNTWIKTLKNHYHETGNLKSLKEEEKIVGKEERRKKKLQKEGLIRRRYHSPYPQEIKNARNFGFRRSKIKMPYF